uniref:Piezo non-specific cation channel R-Ras-binding domain-containing protein n=1 Tax=Plectus sambesii TaxID=2011161 RepID=A0A914XE30_9BILA
CSGVISLPLPLLVFFWGTLCSPRPPKLFWIILIAYTELIVILKFIFQFGFFGWNKESVRITHVTDVYFFPRVIGIEKMAFYAFWDIALLVSLFFHRYMLRRLGLWKDATRIASLTETADTSIGSTHKPNVVELSNSSDSTARNGTTLDPNQIELVQVRGDVGDSKAAGDAGSSNALCGPVGRFYRRLFNPTFRYVRDLYPLMFLMDVIAFFIVTFGYSSFGEGGSGSVVADIQTNRVPLSFVVMLIVLSILIVIDRGLYLRKATICKLIFQYLLVIFIHAWIFFSLPAITARAAMNNGVAQFLYVVKCIYFLISAWQIRNGYPRLCIGNLLTHAYGIFNMVAFKVFMAVPFLFELRTAIDWTWTETTMPLFDFFNMENFFANIYNLKCARHMEAEYPAPRGVPKGKVVKYAMGIPLIVLLVLIIWLPLLAFSLINSIGVRLIPDRVDVTIGIAGYPPLYKMEASGIELKPLSASEFQKLIGNYANAPAASDQSKVLLARQAVAFMNEYAEYDTLKVLLRPQSETYWPISGPSRTALLFELQQN